jgi:hypothetical protein
LEYIGLEREREKWAIKASAQTSVHGTRKEIYRIELASQPAAAQGGNIYIRERAGLSGVVEQR